MNARIHEDIGSPILIKKPQKLPEGVPSSQAEGARREKA
jgi:hypothetical protein